jgi:paraquat-inducible protein B
VRTKSLASVLLGGLAFDDSPVGNASEAVRDGAVFTLFPDQAAAMKQPDPDERRYVLYFNESLEGVAAGSPVTLLGIACGEVTSVGFTFDPRTRRLRGRLEITFSPERLIERLPSAEAAELRDIDRNPAKRTAFLRQAIVRDGLRAQLRSASLISGQRFVAFDYVADPPPAILNWRQEPLELPVVPGVLPAFEKKLTALLNKLDAIPLAQMAGETRESMREARMTLASVRGLVGDIDEKALPGLVAALEDARGALATAQRTLDEASTTLVGPEAPGQRDLRAALQEVTRAARAVRVLSDSIERQPESLLRGRKAEANPR